MQNKFNLTSYNLFKLIKYILPKKKFTIAEIVSFLDTENICVEYETVYKYLRTLKRLGFEFEKVNSKSFKIKKLPFVFSDRENETLINILNKLSRSSLPKKTELCEKLLLFLTGNNTENLFQNETTSQKLDKFIKDGLRLKLFFGSSNSEKETLFELYNVFSEGKNKYLQGYDINKKEVVMYSIDDISSIKQTPTKNKFSYEKEEAILKFSSRVAKAYIPKEEDEIIEKTEDSLVIRTVYYDKVAFYKKILRYTNNCEIIAPAALKDALGAYLSELYQMYDCPK
ncbi:MAG: WYL domain-containing protein [bacterium]|nr:WYL domain-containing protein [bacterium]